MGEGTVRVPRGASVYRSATPRRPSLVASLARLLRRTPRTAPPDCGPQTALNARLLEAVRTQDLELAAHRELVLAHVGFLRHLTAESRATTERRSRLTSAPSPRDYLAEFAAWSAGRRAELRDAAVRPTPPPVPVRGTDPVR